ncbi:MAG: hypothetical protein GXO67_01345, partial [Archaeoglobi archaeon]|nr:hypothetical protein [Archaeoglobi archaeon]
MDAALALIAYLFPKLKMPQVLGLALALLLYRSRNLNSFAFRNDVREDGVSAILTALVLL